MSSYHGWTHRPKRLGGTDPSYEAGSELTAAFWLTIPGTTTPQQRFETLTTWTEVELAASFGFNWDQATATDAVTLIDGDLRARVDSHTVGSVEQIWHCGFVMRLGTYFDVGTANTLEWWDADTTVKMHSFAVRFAGSDYEVSCPLVPAADGNYHMLEQQDTALGVSATKPLEASSTSYDPIDAESAQSGIGLEVWHNVDWVDDVGSFKGPPASRGGWLWGFRYDRPLNV